MLDGSGLWKLSAERPSLVQIQSHQHLEERLLTF